MTYVGIVVNVLNIESKFSTILQANVLNDNRELWHNLSEMAEPITYGICPYGWHYTQTFPPREARYNVF